MGVSSDEISAHGDQDHGVRDVDAFLVITHEASPSCHPSEGALDDPAARQNLETLLIIRPADDLDDEVEIGGFVHEFEPVICAVSEQMLDPRPTLAHTIQNRRAPALSEISAVVSLTIKSRPSVSTAM